MRFGYIYNFQSRQAFNKRSFQDKLMKLDALKETSDCVKKQYEDYILENFAITINGSKVSQHNDADLFSFLLSYNAFKALKSSNSAELLRLPGLHFTAEQFFWISSTQRFCIIERQRETTIRKIYSDFPIEAFRVINALRNNKDFARDFNCAPGSGMNPESKC